MAKFQVDDMVEMPNVPIPPVKVLEVKQCEDPNCPFAGQEVFRFQDPQYGDMDWMHSAEFRKVSGP